MENAGMNTRNAKPRVGKYEIGRLLGEGNYGKIRFARHVDSGKGVAIKILDRSKVFQHKMVEQIKREISIMKLIKHPNVVQLHEVMASKTKIYLVLDLVTGGELFDKVRDIGKLKELEARKYFQQLINAVDYCHSRGVYHRDLKTENLLLDLLGNLKICDFGFSALSQHHRDDGLLHTTCGTPNYVAPEVISGKGYDGAMADVWSCGVILFVMMAGYLPFDESNIVTLYKKISKAEFKFPKRFPSGAKKLIERILDPNPKTRISVSEIINDEWFKKGYKPPTFVEAPVSVDDVDAAFNGVEETLPELTNAFELITMSQGLDLGSLFAKPMGIVKTKNRLPTRYSPVEVMQIIEKAATHFGYNYQKQDDEIMLCCANAGRKGNLQVNTKIFEVVPSLVVVEFKKIAGDTLEYDEEPAKVSYLLRGSKVKIEFAKGKRRSKQNVVNATSLLE